MSLLICLSENTVIEKHVFHAGTTTRVVCNDAVVMLRHCEVRGHIILECKNSRFNIAYGTTVYPGATITGHATLLAYYVRVPVLFNCASSIRIVSDCENTWTEEELGIFRPGTIVNYHMYLYGGPPPLASYINDVIVKLMYANYGFHAHGPFDLPPMLTNRTRRRLSHAMLALRSAVEVKTLGVHSAMRRFPRDLLRMCYSFLVN